MVKKNKSFKRSWLTLANIVIILSALAVAFKIYALPPIVEKNTQRIEKLEKDNVASEIQLRYHTELLTEMRADIKRLLMMKKN